MTSPTPCQKCKAELAEAKRERDDAVKAYRQATAEINELETRVAELEALVARRHDSTCSKEGELAVEACPECSLAAPCPRTYPNDPNTAEDPCEDCGRDERKHEIGPR